MTVNCICPSLIRSDFTEKAFLSTAELTDKIAKAIPVQKIGDTAEIAGAAIYCASRVGAYTTGQNIVIDGGYMTCIPDMMGEVFEEFTEEQAKKSQ